MQWLQLFPSRQRLRTFQVKKVKLFFDCILYVFSLKRAQMLSLSYAAHNKIFPKSKSQNKKIILINITDTKLTRRHIQEVYNYVLLYFYIFIVFKELDRLLRSHLLRQENYEERPAKSQRRLHFGLRISAAHSYSSFIWSRDFACFSTTCSRTFNHILFCILMHH